MIRSNAHLDRMENWNHFSMDDLEAAVEKNDNDINNYAENIHNREKLIEAANRAEKLQSILRYHINSALFKNADVMKHIFLYLVPKYPDTQNHGNIVNNLCLVSKFFSELVINLRNERIQKKFLPLSNFGIKTTNDALAYITKYHLTKINLSSFYLLKGHFKQLTKLKIEVLHLDSIPSTLVPNMESLKTFSLFFKNDFFIKEKQFISVAKNCPYLTKIKLKWRSVTDLYIKELVKGCKRLEWIDLQHSWGLTDLGLIEIAKMCTNLHTIKVSNVEITDKSVIELARTHPDLKKVHLKSTSTTDLCLTEFKNCKNLHTMHLSGRQYSEKSLVEFAQAHPNLKELGLANTCVTDVGVMEILKALQNLRKIWLEQTFVSKQKMAELRSSYPKLKFCS